MLLFKALKIKKNICIYISINLCLNHNLLDLFEMLEVCVF